MKITLSQRRQLRKLAALSTGLQRERLALNDLQRDKVVKLQQKRLDLKRLEQNAQRYGAFSELGTQAARDEAAADSLPKIAECREDIRDLEEDIRDLEARMESVSLDANPAARLVERVLKHSGQELDDFPPQNAIFWT